MLQVAFIRENRATVLKGLAKRNLKNAEALIAKTILADEERRAIQTALDAVLAESNKLSKEIGISTSAGTVAVVLLTPLFQTIFFPDLMQV